MTGISYATSAEMAGELGAFPGYAGTARTCSASCATTAAPPMATPTAMTALHIAPVPLDAASCARPAPRRACPRRLEPRRRARRDPRLPQRPGDRHRADRHDRPDHGLRHHRHRAGLRAGQVQEARRRRLLQDHQPRRARGAPRPRLSTSAQSKAIIDYAVGRGTLKGAPGDQPRRRSRPRASPRRRSPQVEAGLADRLRHQVRLQQMDARRGFPDLPRHHRGRDERPGLRSPQPGSASRRRISRRLTSTAAER